MASRCAGAPYGVAEIDVGRLLRLRRRDRLLPLLTAPFLHYFLALAGCPLAAVKLEWLDPEQEIRYCVDNQPT